MIEQCDPAANNTLHNPQMMRMMVDAFGALTK
jgi:hypothetical protein